MKLGIGPCDEIYCICTRSQTHTIHSRRYAKQAWEDNDVFNGMWNRCVCVCARARVCACLGCSPAWYVQVSGTAHCAEL